MSLSQLINAIVNQFRCPAPGVHTLEQPIVLMELWW